MIVGSTTNLSIILANTSVLPLKAHGVVRTKGTISLGGPTNGKSSLDFRAGKLTVNHTQTSGGTQPSLNPKTCVASQTERGVYTVVGGTGRFYGAKGHRKYKISLRHRLPAAEERQVQLIAVGSTDQRQDIVPRLRAAVRQVTMTCRRPGANRILGQAHRITDTTGRLRLRQSAGPRPEL